MPARTAVQRLGAERTAPRNVGSWAALVFVLTLAMSACSGPTVDVNEPQPPAVVGFYALELSRTAPPQFSSLSVDPDGATAWRASVFEGPIVSDGIRLEATGNSSVRNVGGRTYVHAEFLLTNDTDEPLQHLVLLAYHRDEFRSGTAISQPVLGSGAAAPDWLVRSILPTHRLDFDVSLAGSPEAFTGRPTMSDFTAYGEDDVPTLGAYEAVRTVFPYGFSIGDGSPVSPGAQAHVHIAFAFPTLASTRARLAGFTWNAVLVRDDRSRVTQAPEENHERGWQAVLARAAASESDAIVVIGSGERTTTDPSTCARLIGLPNVRIAGERTDDPTYVGLVGVAGPPEFPGCEGATP